MAATREQLAARQRLLDGGATHVGWKLAMSERENLGGPLVVGHLTSATLLEPGAPYRARPGEDLHLDVEAYVELAGDGPEAIAGYGVALEVVDLTPLAGEPDSIVATNIFHRAVSFSPRAQAEPGGAEVGVLIGGELRDAGMWPRDISTRLHGAAEVLEAVGSGLRAGDRIITGAIIQVPITAGERIAAVIGADTSLRLEIA